MTFRKEFRCGPNGAPCRLDDKHDDFVALAFRPSISNKADDGQMNEYPPPALKQIAEEGYDVDRYLPFFLFLKV